MTRFAAVLMAAFAASVAQPLTLSAQGNTTLKGLEGKKVRITSTVFESAEATGALKVQGTMLDVRGDSIRVLQDGGLTVHVELSRLRTLDVYGGKDRVRGAFTGGVMGAVVGLALALTAEPDCDGEGYGLDCRNDGSTPTMGEYYTHYGSLFGLVGATIGAIMGADRWDAVLTQRRVTIAPAKGGGIRVGLSF